MTNCIRDWQKDMQKTDCPGVLALPHIERFTHALNAQNFVQIYLFGDKTYTIEIRNN